MIARSPSAAPADPGRWSRSRLAVLCFVAAWLLIQVALPVVGLASERPARFAWQMYTSVTSLPEVTIRLTSGEERPVDTEALIARPRADADYATALTTRLCEDPSVAAVLVNDQRGQRVESCH